MGPFFIFIIIASNSNSIIIISTSATRNIFYVNSKYVVVALAPSTSGVVFVINGMEN